MGLGYKNENNWDNEIAQEVARQSHVVPASLVKALIAVESAWQPRAFRNEPAINDASRGLMQILYKTAQGEGYKGTAEGLLDPATNIRYGVAYLASQARRYGGDLKKAVAAYNYGSAKIATAETRICLARDQQTGECISYFTAAPGQFYNQPYVNKVMSAWPAYGGSGGSGGVLGIGLLTLGVYGLSRLF